MTDYKAIDSEYERDGRPEPVLVLASEVRPTRVQWLWESRIPRGKVTLVEGDPGEGKSTSMLDIAARVSTGAPMPDGSPGVEGDVVIMSAEDGEADTIVPRLIAAGANLKRIAILRGVRRAGTPEALLSLPADIEALEDAITRTNAKLVIIDPLMVFLGGHVNSWKDQDVRRALAPLAALAEKTGAAIVVIRHLTKGSGGLAVHRGGGSIGIIGAARSALLVARDPDDDSEQRRILAPVKCNLGREPPSLMFTLETAENGAARIRWGGESYHRANDLVATVADPFERSRLDEAVEFLRDALAEGPQPVNEINRARREAGITERTFDRARSRLGVKSRPSGFGGPRLLHLPDSQSPPVSASVRQESIYGGDGGDWEFLADTENSNRRPGESERDYEQRVERAAMQEEA